MISASCELVAGKSWWRQIAAVFAVAVLLALDVSNIENIQPERPIFMVTRAASRRAVAHLTDHRGTAKWRRYTGRTGSTTTASSAP